MIMLPAEDEEFNSPGGCELSTQDGIERLIQSCIQRLLLRGAALDLKSSEPLLIATRTLTMHADPCLRFPSLSSVSRQCSLSG